MQRAAATVFRYDVAANGVLELVLNRPSKLNAMAPVFFDELDQLVARAVDDEAVRVVLIHGGESKGFTAGLDLGAAVSVLPGGPGGEETTAEKSAKFLRLLERWQRPLQTLSSCRKPVIAAVHGACIGGGVDLITACDIRLASQDAYFSIREVKVGMVADLGTLQRVGRLMNPSAASQMAFSGLDYSASQVQAWGLVSQVFPTKEDLLTGARKLAGDIASQSPLVLAGIKETLNYARDHNVADSLKQVQLWNAAFLSSGDLTEAFSAYFEKRPPVFKSKL